MKHYGNIAFYVYPLLNKISNSFFLPPLNCFTISVLKYSPQIIAVFFPNPKSTTPWCYSAVHTGITAWTSNHSYTSYAGKLSCLRAVYERHWLPHQPPPEADAITGRPDGSPTDRHYAPRHRERRQSRVAFPAIRTQPRRPAVVEGER